MAAAAAGDGDDQYDADIAEALRQSMLPENIPGKPPSPKFDEEPEVVDLTESSQPGRPEFPFRWSTDAPVGQEDLQDSIGEKPSKRQHHLPPGTEDDDDKIDPASFGEIEIGSAAAAAAPPAAASPAKFNAFPFAQLKGEIEATDDKYKREYGSRPGLVMRCLEKCGNEVCTNVPILSIDGRSYTVHCFDSELDCFPWGSSVLCGDCYKNDAYRAAYLTSIHGKINVVLCGVARRLSKYLKVIHTADEQIDIVPRHVGSCVYCCDISSQDMGAASKSPVCNRGNCICCSKAPRSRCPEAIARMFQLLITHSAFTLVIRNDTMKVANDKQFIRSVTCFGHPSTRYNLAIDRDQVPCTICRNAVILQVSPTFDSDTFDRNQHVAVLDIFNMMAKITAQYFKVSLGTHVMLRCLLNALGVDLSRVTIDARSFELPRCAVTYEEFMKTFDIRDFCPPFHLLYSLYPPIADEKLREVIRIAESINRDLAADPPCYVNSKGAEMRATALIMVKSDDIAMTTDVIAHRSPDLMSTTRSIATKYRGEEGAELPDIEYLRCKEDRPYPMRNAGATCFANAAFQVIRSMQPVMDAMEPRITNFVSYATSIAKGEFGYLELKKGLPNIQRTMKLSEDVSDMWIPDDVTGMIKQNIHLPAWDVIYKLIKEEGVMQDVTELFNYTERKVRISTRGVDIDVSDIPVDATFSSGNKVIIHPLPLCQTKLVDILNSGESTMEVTGDTFKYPAMFGRFQRYLAFECNRSISKSTNPYAADAGADVKFLSYDSIVKMPMAFDYALPDSMSRRFLLKAFTMCQSAYTLPEPGKHAADMATQRAREQPKFHDAAMHYTACCRYGTRWWLCNDSQITEITGDDKQTTNLLGAKVDRGSIQNINAVVCGLASHYGDNVIYEMLPHNFPAFDAAVPSVAFKPEIPKYSPEEFAASTF